MLMRPTLDSFAVVPAALRKAAIAVALALCGLCATQASAATVEPDCFLAGLHESLADIERIAADAEPDNCVPAKEVSGLGDWTVVFRLPADSNAEYLSMRLGKVDSVAVSARNAEGEWLRTTYAGDKLTASYDGPEMVAGLPQDGGEARVVIAAIEGSGHPPTILKSAISLNDPAEYDARLIELMLLSALVGMVVIPALIYLGFFRVLSETFLIWYALFSISLAGIVLLRSGLINVFVPLPVDIWRIANIINMALVVAFAVMFTSRFIERDKLTPQFRMIAPYVAGWTIAMSVIYAGDPPFLEPIGSAFHTIGMVPAALLVCAMLADAYRRGSRSVILQLAAWIPLLSLFLLQILNAMRSANAYSDFLPWFYVSLLWQVVISSWAVADRFFVMKRQRDSAILEADVLSRRSERDPLTGLYNRRALDSRWHDLQSCDYRTVAILDIDHFKTVNDVHGHIVGDQVLKIIGQVLRGDRDNIAIRMGGEEFLILLRGSDAVTRADLLRRRVTVRVAEEMHDLEMPVTASMGTVTLPEKADNRLEFSDVYSRVDLLLYEAKRSGRNRMIARNWDVLELETFPDKDSVAAE